MLKFLVVSHDAVLLATLDAMLSGFNQDIALQVISPEVSSHSLGLENPDVVLLDIENNETLYRSFNEIVPQNSSVIFIGKESKDKKIFQNISTVLTKPVTPATLSETLISLLQRRLLSKVIKHNNSIDELTENSKPNHAVATNRFLVKSPGRLYFIMSHEIDWIEALGDYVRLHCGSTTHIVRKKIGDIESKLDRNVFLRINRSAIINIDSIKELNSLFHGDYLVVLKNGTELNLSRNYRDVLVPYLNGTV